MASISEDLPLPSLKDLASSESSLRRTTLVAILSHITSRPPTSPPTPTQSLQLWRALSVALYMHDSKSAISVQNLVQTLASTFSLVYQKDIELQQQQQQQQEESSTSNHLSESEWPWLSTHHTAFWEILSREWAGIDSHRLNKYLLLVRFVVRQIFANLLLPAPPTETEAKPDSVPESRTTRKTTSSLLVSSQIQILSTWPLSPRDRKVPDGLRLHVLDVWSDELLAEIQKVNTTNVTTDEDEIDEQEVKRMTELLMAPVRTLAKEALSKGVKIRAKEALKGVEEEHVEEAK